MFNNSIEIMLAITEEVGEVAQEIALLEKVGTKINWKNDASKARLLEEIDHVRNLLDLLEKHYQ